MTNPQLDRALISAWENHRVWSATADSLIRRIRLWRTAFLVLTVAGAALVALGTQILESSEQLGRVLSGAGAVALAVTPLVQHYRLGKKSLSDWNRARSASEGLKSEVYQYQANADRYSGEDSDAVLVEQTMEITDSVADLNQFAAAVEVEDKPPPPPLDSDAYIEHRVDPQVDGFYRPKAVSMARMLARLRGVEFVLALAAAALGAYAAFAPSESVAAGIGAWVAVITTSAAAVAAHVGASRYEYLVNTYMATANRLQSIRDRWLIDSARGQASFDDFVRRCEEAISVENHKWMAKWAGTPASDEGSGDSD